MPKQNQISQQYKINASIKEVWNALTDPKIIIKWSGAPAKMNSKQGTKFSLWNKDIWGTNSEVIPDKKLVQEWYGGKWDKPSIVVFQLSEKSSVTTVKLTHNGVPASEVNNFANGWSNYYMGPLKTLI